MHKCEKYGINEQEGCRFPHKPKKKRKRRRRRRRRRRRTKGKVGTVFK
jgi:hypothetical protein